MELKNTQTHIAILIVPERYRLCCHASPSYCLELSESVWFEGCSSIRIVVDLYGQTRRFFDIA